MKFVNIVCCHKASDIPVDSNKIPIQVGRALSNVKLQMLGDDTGDNISSKNHSYCELTGIYWAWKNMQDVDVFGLSHYRRYFDFHNQVRSGFPHMTLPEKSIYDVNLSISGTDICEIKPGVIILPAPINLRSNLMLHYCSHHISDDYKMLSRIIHNTQPEYLIKAFENVMMNKNKISPYNMFIMCKDDFNEYCSWLFPLLSKVENSINIDHYDFNQGRVYGYMAERLLNVWVESKQMRVIYKPVIIFSDNYDHLNDYSHIRYRLRCLLNNLSCYFQHYKF